jgi:hypothetical protein
MTISLVVFQLLSNDGLEAKDSRLKSVRLFLIVQLSTIFTREGNNASIAAVTI